MLCKCGCGQELPDYSQNKTFIYGHKKRFIETHKDEMIRCACGCGQLKPRYDQYGDEHLYLRGHNPASDKQKAIRIQMNKQRKGKFRHSEETKTKIKQSIRKYNEENPIPQERKDRISQALTGREFSLAIRNKMSQAAKKRLLDPTKHPRYGIALTQETKNAISISLIKFYEAHPETKRLREDNSMWCGGISYEPYGLEFNETLRKAIRERDNYTCQICRKYGNCVHHINYDKTSNQTENLINLCNSCHSKTNYNRNLWIIYFFLKFWVGQANLEPGLPLSSSS